MADDKRDPSRDDDLSNEAAETPEGRDLAADLPDPEVDAAGEIDADYDGVPDVEQPDEGYDASEDNEVLAEATAAAAESRRPSAPRKKSAPTPRQKHRPAEEDKRTGPVEFVGQSVDELKKVVWPTGEQVRGYFVVVLVFVAFIIAVVTVLDLLFGMGVTRLFG
ncbi:preprotein translocase subunit SecE [Enemella sp. A6]|uniref:preprotein translocase subunit SecE n=1 Tax=Enemella sp. A6 TaxID=3440152 RepID=UPI003EB74A86